MHSGTKGLISIIVCHRDPAYLVGLKKSFDADPGVEIEWVIIDNSKNQYSIFQAYNLGTQQSTGEVLCFAHEDILIRTPLWGRKVLDHFEDAAIGMIGVAGGTAMAKAPSPWWSGGVQNQHAIQVIQHWRTKQPKRGYYTPLRSDGTVSRAYHNPSGKMRQEVVTLDGLWFCIRRSVFEQISFDEQSFQGFHCYDSDISLQVGSIAKLFVVYDLEIEHFSDANANQEFYDALLIQYRKWKGELPKSVRTLSEGEKAELNTEALLEYAYTLRSSGLYTDGYIRKMIKEVLKETGVQVGNKSSYLLWLWSRLGYSLARYPYFLIRKFIRP